MINALKPQYREFGKAFLLTNGVQKFFKYSIVDNKAQAYNTPTQNIIAGQDQRTIQTTWDLPFKPNMQVVLDGEVHKIMRCQKVQNEINEQSLGLVKNTFSAFWVIELVR